MRKAQSFNNRVFRLVVRKNEPSLLCQLRPFTTSRKYSQDSSSSFSKREIRGETRVRRGKELPKSRGKRKGNNQAALLASLITNTVNSKAGTSNKHVSYALERLDNNSINVLRGRLKRTQQILFAQRPQQKKLKELKVRQKAALEERKEGETRFSEEVEPNNYARKNRPAGVEKVLEGINIILKRNEVLSDVELVMLITGAARVGAQELAVAIFEEEVPRRQVQYNTGSYYLLQFLALRRDNASQSF